MTFRINENQPYCQKSTYMYMYMFMQSGLLQNIDTLWYAFFQAARVSVVATEDRAPLVVRDPGDRVVRLV